MNDIPSKERRIGDIGAGEAMAIGSALESLAADWRRDPGLRARAASEPRETLVERGLDVPSDGADMRIVANTGDVFHLVMPPDPNVDLVDSELSPVAGGSNCLGSAATATTFGSVPSCLSSAATASSASTGPRPGSS